MSGLYNMFAGVNPATPLLLEAIGVSMDFIPRFRDVYIKPKTDGQVVVIYTRTGGGNREEYVAENAALAEYPNYMTDYDDDFDCTYAHFEFRVPDDKVMDVKEIEAVYNFTPREKWDAAFEAIKKMKPEKNP